jgi:hypothetical protein
VGFSTQVHGSNARNLSFANLKLAKMLSFLLSLIFSLQQNQRTRGLNKFFLEAGEGQTMYTSKCENNKMKERENKYTNIFIS